MFNALRQKGKNARHKSTFEDNILRVKCLRIPYENERQMHDTHCVALTHCIFHLFIPSFYSFVSISNPVGLVLSFYSVEIIL